MRNFIFSRLGNSRGKKELLVSVHNEYIIMFIGDENTDKLKMSLSRV